MSEQSPEVPDGATPAAEERAPRRRRPRRVVRRGTEREAVLGVTADERGGHEPNDDRLRRDVPPHW